MYQRLETKHMTCEEALIIQKKLCDQDRTAFSTHESPIGQPQTPSSFRKVRMKPDGIDPDENILVSSDGDGAFFERYSWSTYKSLPPPMNVKIAACALQDLLATAKESPPGDQNWTVERCEALLGEQAFQDLFLRCWEQGSFQEMWSNAVFLSVTGVPLSDDDVPPAHSGEEDLLPGEVFGDSGGTHNETNQDPAVEISGGNFYDIRGDVWNIQYTENRAKDIAVWLSGIDQRVTHNNVSKKRAPETGLWFIDTREFEDFMNNPGRQILWCYGIPGVGKTVMASFVINFFRELRLPNTVLPLAFIYFNHKNRGQQSIDGVIQSISRQVYEAAQEIDPHSEICSIYEALYSSHSNGGHQATMPELIEALKSALEHLDEFFIVIDALDEYLQEHSDKKIRLLLDTILGLGESGKIKLLVTSRWLSGFEEIFRELGSLRMQIEVEDQDIQRYIEARIEERGFDFELTPALHQQIITTVMQVAAGRFLMAELHMNVLLTDKISPGDVEDALETLPDEVDQAYEQIMERIKGYPEKRRKLGQKAIMLTAYTKRPLLIEELQHALAVENGKSDISKYVVPLSTITAACAGILTVNEGTLGFVHFTTQEYFDKSKGLHFPSADTEIAHTCLDYLTHEVLLQELYNEYPMVFVKKFPFYDYAALNWGIHTSHDDEKLNSRICAIVAKDDALLKHQASYLIYKQAGLAEELISDGAGLFVSTFHNHTQSMSLILEGMQEIPATSHWRTPFILVTQKHQMEAARVLIRKFGIGLRVGYRRSALTHAVKNGLSELVMFLIQFEQDGSSTTQKKREEQALSAIVESIEADQPEMLDMLLGTVKPARISIDLNKLLHTALAWAWAGIEVTRVLVKHGAGVNDLDEKGTSTLYTASNKGKKDIVEFLLSRGATKVVNTLSGEGTALLGAALRDDLEIAQLLVQHGASVNVPNSMGQTPLGIAAGTGNVEMVKLFLAYGGESTINTQDHNGNTAISLAAMHKHCTQWERDESKACDVVALLLSQGNVDINPTNNDGLTPLDCAYAVGFTGLVVPLLQEHGARCAKSDLDCASLMIHAAMHGNEVHVKSISEQGGFEKEPRTPEGYTPLMLAAQRNYDRVVKILCGEPWVDINARDNKGRSPLAWAASGGHEEALWTLLEQEGIDVNQKDEEGITPLGHSLDPLASTAVAMDLLCRRDVDFLSRDKNGRHALSHAVCSSSKNRSFHVEELVSWALPDRERSIDINSRDNGGRTALSLACGLADAPLVRLLLRSRYETADVNAQDMTGRTPLSWAVCGVKKGAISHSAIPQQGELSEVRESVLRSLRFSSSSLSRRKPIANEGENGLQLEVAVKGVVDLLLEKEGLKINLPDNKGRTPLWYAEKAGYQRIADLLRSKSAVVHCVRPKSWPNQGSGYQLLQQKALLTGLSHKRI